MTTFRLFFLFLILLFIFSCKKKESSQPPVINILKPSSGATYNPGDTIFIEADISSSRTLSSVGIHLLNSNYVSVDHDESVTISSTSYHLTFPYIIENIYLTSGNYLITLSTNDGANTTNEYQTVVIHEIPRKVKAIYVLTVPDSTHVAVSKLDSTANLVPQFLLLCDYAGSAIDSKNQLLMTLGKSKGGFSQYDLRTNSLVFNVQPYNTFQQPSFNNLCLYNSQTFVSYTDGHVKAFDQSAQLRFRSGDSAYYVPNAITASSLYVFVEGYYSGTQQNKIIVQFYPSGGGKQECYVSEDIVAMFATDDNHLLVFGNENGNGKIFTYDVFANGTNNLLTENGITFNNALSIDGDNYALATNQGLYAYQSSINYLVALDLSEPVYNVEYDNVNGILYAAAGKKIKEYLFPQPPVINTILTTDTVAAIRVLYDK